MKQIGTEVMSDWPVYALTLRELLTEIGFEISECEDKIDFVCGHLDRNLLDAYPMLLEDDGMGYGVNEKFITDSISTDVYYNENVKEDVFNVFIDKKSDFVDNKT